MTDPLREALASGNYLQVYDHRQSRWLSPDEAVAVLAALAGSEPAGLRERVIKSLDFRYLNPNTDEYVVPVRRVEEALAATPTASPTGEDSDD